ncbi:hypothetical protein H0H93_006409 [Arthromyces matolae]|nr:hypothetical protein H0H93_006409 [Arthromyces matolae]
MSRSRVTAIHKILGACGAGNVICIVALPVLYRDTMYKDVTVSIQKARGSAHQCSKDVILVAPATDQNHRYAGSKYSKRAVDVWVPAFPILGEGNVEIDMWLAAVMRAAGVTASFVSWYWNEKHEKPEPALIKSQLLDAVLLTSFGLAMIHIPNTVSGKPDSAIPPQLPSTRRKRPSNDPQSDKRQVRKILATPQHPGEGGALSIDPHLSPAFLHTVDSNLNPGDSSATPWENSELTDRPPNIAMGVKDQITTSYGMHEDHSHVNSQSSPESSAQPLFINPAVLHHTDSDLIQHPPLATTWGYPEYTYSSLNIPRGIEDRITTSSGMHQSRQNPQEDHRRVN